MVPRSGGGIGKRLQNPFFMKGRFPVLPYPVPLPPVGGDTLPLAAWFKNACRARDYFWGEPLLALSNIVRLSGLRSLVNERLKINEGNRRFILYMNTGSAII